MRDRGGEDRDLRGEDLGSPGPGDFLPHIRSYRDLIVWQKSMDLIDACYTLTSRYPSTERFGLVSQIRRAAVSVAANIAEGHARAGAKQFLHQLSIARASLRELETLLIVSERQGFVISATFVEIERQTDEIGRMLSVLSRRIAASGEAARDPRH